MQPAIYPLRKDETRAGPNEARGEEGENIQGPTKGKKEREQKGNQSSGIKEDQQIQLLRKKAKGRRKDRGKGGGEKAEGEGREGRAQLSFP